MDVGGNARVVCEGLCTVRPRRLGAKLSRVIWKGGTSEPSQQLWWTGSMGIYGVHLSQCK